MPQLTPLIGLFIRHFRIYKADKVVMLDKVDVVDNVHGDMIYKD